ncbi:prepilin peptidase [Antrihabitans stalactiti]|uniref:Prepilin peptidase n=1 Tax=Antrihabitans stalactiti TaxID=2584121 RepID=A0A848KC05_9NOCA|nr:prepilin peptidase [Antrihabitans stalactiti]NMN93597.1 prepilin peptidase [Antrihabitans stalactiti]
MISWLAIMALCAWCAALSFVDIAERRLPNVLTVCGGIAVLGYGFAVGRGGVALIGGLLLALLYLAVHVIAPTAMGAGDVKLALGLGAAAALGGPEVWVWAALLAPLGTALAGVFLMMRRGTVGRTVVPHGPFMCASTLIALAAR